MIHTGTCAQVMVKCSVKALIKIQFLDGDPVCGDKSDQSYCLHEIFTGCFANTSLGMKIMNCDSCFCELRNKTSKIRREGMFYKISGAGASRPDIMGRICMER